MSLTSPVCPSADEIIENVKEEIEHEFKEWEVEVEITFEPLWSPDFIKNEDFKKMFE